MTLDATDASILKRPEPCQESSESSSSPWDHARAGMSLGTLHDVGPGQVTGEKDITARSDVYSLAGVPFEMLAGNPSHTAHAFGQSQVSLALSRSNCEHVHTRSSSPGADIVGSIPVKH